MIRKNTKQIFNRNPNKGTNTNYSKSENTPARNYASGSYAARRRNPMITLSDSRRKVTGKRKGGHYTAYQRRTPDKKEDTQTPAAIFSVKPLTIPNYVKEAIITKPTMSHSHKILNKAIARKDRASRKKRIVPIQQEIQTFPSKEGTLRIIPVGGCEEVGRNMTIFEYVGKGGEATKDIVILDMGLQFPEEDMPGIDYIIPNIEYLKGKEKNIRAVIFSHGHLDHIGAAPILLEKLGNPTIVGRNLTLEMIKHRVEDYKKNTSQNLKTIYIKNITDNMQFGAFKVKYFAVEHAIMDAVGVVLETPSGTIIHPGDWRMEKDPQGRPIVTYNHLANLKTPTILMLESLAVTHKEGQKRITEKEMLDNLTQILSEAPGRIIIGTFASQIERIKQIIEISNRMGKKVALDGFSMKINMEIAERLGYVKLKKGSLIKINEINKYDNNKIVVLATGAQGESNAVLSRIVNNNHKYIKLQKNDTIVFSSSVIPGNERTIQRLKDNLYRLSDNVIHSDIMDVHVSGHGTQDDIKEMLRQIQPTYFIPVYANHYMLKETAKLAGREGFPADKIFIPDNGSVIEFPLKGKPIILDKKINTDYVFVDGLGIGDVSNIVLRDRKMMSEDGMIVIIVTVDRKTGRLLHSPDLISRGFIYMKDNKNIVEGTRVKVKQILKNTDPRIEAFPDFIKDKIRNDIGQFLFTKTARRPMVLPVVIEV